MTSSCAFYIFNHCAASRYDNTIVAGLNKTFALF